MIAQASGLLRRFRKWIKIMSTEAQHLADRCNQMPVHHCSTFHRRQLGEDSPFTGEPAEERFKGMLLGMNYGSFRLSENAITKLITVEQREPERAAVWREWDRKYIPFPQRNA